MQPMGRKQLRFPGKVDHHIRRRRSTMKKIIFTVILIIVVMGWSVTPIFSKDKPKPLVIELMGKILKQDERIDHLEHRLNKLKKSTELAYDLLNRIYLLLQSKGIRF